MNELVEKCIKMNVYSYISYFSKRNDLTIEEVDYIREQVNNYIDENFTKIFDMNFTINGVAM